MIHRAFLLSVLAAVLAGCQTTTHNPYSWRYASGGQETVCVASPEETSEVLKLTLRQALRKKGFKALETDGEDARCTKYLRFTAVMGGWSGARLESARLELRNKGEARPAYSASVSGFSAGDASLNLPEDDYNLTIRVLVDRMFPEPQPWSAN